MPTGVEYYVNEAAKARAQDQRFLQVFGRDRWRNKKGQEGVIAYEFPNKIHLEAAKVELEWLGDVYFYTRPTSRDYYFLPNLGRGLEVRRFAYFSSDALLAVWKPFPDEDYEKLLTQREVDFRRLAAFRLADLTAEEVRGHWEKGDRFWMGNVIAP